MPQLDRVSYLSQFVWMCVFLFGFHLVIRYVYLPSICRTLKVSLSLQKGLNSENSENSGDTGTSKVFNRFEKFNLLNLKFANSLLKKAAQKFNLVSKEASKGIKALNRPNSNLLIEEAVSSIISSRLRSLILNPVGMRGDLFVTIFDEYYASDSQEHYLQDAFDIEQEAVLIDISEEFGIPTYF